MHRSVRLAVAAVVLACAAGAAVAAPVYSNDFEGSTVGSEWSRTTVSTTPGGSHGATRFLGELGNGSVTLTLNSLQPHTDLTLTLDLFIIRTWDGNGEVGGGVSRDAVMITGDDALLMDHTFSNVPGETQTFPTPDRSARNPAQTSATAVNSLGYTFNGQAMDALYHLSLTFPHSADSVTFRFTSTQNEVIANESWGIDNVAVNAAGAIPVPLPSAALMCPFGVAVAAWATRRLRAHA
jgi:hypothetical protein